MATRDPLVIETIHSDWISSSMSRTASSSSTPKGTLAAIRYLPDRCIALCTTCKVAVPKTCLRGHLSFWHKGCKNRKAILEEFGKLPIITTVDELEIRADGLPPLPFLLPPQQGYFCPKCTSFRTISWETLRIHTRKEHGMHGVTLRQEELSCHLQRWTVGQGAYHSPYWIVDMESYNDDRPLSSCPRDREVVLLQDPANAEARTLADMEADEEARIQEQDDYDATLDYTLEIDENSDWLRGCGWPNWFHHKPVPLLLTAASLPTTTHARDLFLGRWNTIECISPASSESVLQLLVVASHRVLDRCQETLATTPRTLRCWVRSWAQHYSPYPFDLPTAPTIKRYRRVWISAICYFMRLRLLARHLGESTMHLCGFELSQAQTSAMDSVSAMLSDVAINTSDRSDTAPIPIECTELLFQLFVTFWTQLPVDGNLESVAIARFSGVLGIHPVEHSFRRAYDYTPLLSALIWIGRLILLEYSLPLRPYNTLPTPWPSRDSYHDIRARLCNQIRPKYLQRGTLSPIGYLIERLRHGRAIAQHEGPRTNISWSSDGQTLSIGQGAITIPELRRVVHDVITKVQQQVEDLVFDWWPAMHLSSIHDDMSNRRPGYSFVSEPMNNLQSSFRLLSKQAFSPRGRFSFQGSGRQRIERYLRGRDRLVQLLYAAIHLTSGMPARSEELRRIRWANTPSSARNIFVHNGMIILVFSYNKAGKNHNNSFYIVRRPCVAVEKALFVYLGWIRPFSDFLTRELQAQQGTAINRHLFTRHDWETECFSSAVCLKSLQRSAQWGSFPITVQAYRQLAIAISKKHIPALLKAFDAHTPQDYDGFLRLLAFQTGHKPATHSTAYALDTAFPAKLQPELISRYLDNSRIWHEFLSIAQTDVVEATVDVLLDSRRKTYDTAGYYPDPEDEENSADAPQSGTEWQSDSSSEGPRKMPGSRRLKQGTKRKRYVLGDRETSISPRSKKILRLQRELAQLAQSKNQSMTREY